MSATEIRKAFAKRETSIAQNLESMTLKSVRQQLADDMGVDPDSLKAHKDLIASLVDKMIASQQGQKSNKPGSAAKGGTKASPASKPKPKLEPKKAAKKRAASVDEDDEDDEVSGAEDDASNSSSDDSDPSSPSPKKKKGALKTTAKPASGAQKIAPSTERLKQLCRGASISIPTSLYARHRGDARALDEALGELLGRHGLHARSTASEVAKVKASLQLQRDLEGIDTSNIVQGGRRRAAAQRRPLREADSEEESEEEEEPRPKKPRPAQKVSRRAMLEGESRQSEESEASEAENAKARGRSSEDRSEDDGSKKESGSEDDASSASDDEAFSASGDEDAPAKAPRRKERSLVSSSEESD